MAQITISAEPRTILGKKVAQLRRAGKTPANIYGHNVPSTAVTINTNTFNRLHHKLASTTILQLEIAGEAPRPVMVHHATTDPRSGNVLHVQFYQVNLLEKITATIPIVSSGQPESVLAGTGILLQALEFVEVSGLPMDLPPDIEVDVSNLHDSHEGIYVRDLPISGKLELKTPGDELVFKIVAPQAAAEDDVEAPEGETPAEGATEATEETASAGD